MKSTGQQAWEWLEIARTISVEGPGVTRFCATDEHARLLDIMRQWMNASGMTHRTDNVGNLVGRYPSSTRSAPTLLFGSHQDTVPNGGAYDGILGVILPLAMVHTFHQQGKVFPFNIDVVAFTDEEGSRFQSTLIGSKALAGTLTPDLLTFKDDKEISLYDALKTFGCDPDNFADAAYDPEEMLGYVECHIEQGPRLEQADQAVGVVSAITGIERHQLIIHGKANHAGTVPMDMRQDALVGASRVIQALDNHCKAVEDMVGVVGKIENYPNGVNVIPQRTEITLELRSPNDPTRIEARNTLYRQIDKALTELNLTYDLSQTYEQEAVQCDADMTSQLVSACQSKGQKGLQLFSGAGHDGLAIKDLCPISMLFMRCKDGLSHHPDEAIKESDLEVAADVIKAFCSNLSATVS